MALTKVTGDFIKAGSITQGHLHSSHGITTSHITEGDKLFFTNARVDSRIGDLSTSNLSEGTNLYYTDTRARAAISVSGNALSYNSSTGVITSNFEESPTFTGNVTITGNINAAKGIFEAANNQISIVDSDDSQDFRVQVNAGVFSVRDHTNTQTIFKISANSGTDALVLNSSGATFSGRITGQNGITVTGGATGADIYINNTSPTLGFTDSNSFTDANDIYIVRGTGGNKLQFQWYDDSAGTTTETFNIDNSGNANFSGDITVSGGDITLGGTGRIQGIDTVSANTDAANKLYVDNQVAGIVDSAPSTLDTLNELAAALGDDANFSTTVTNSIATKMPLAGGNFTGNVAFTGTSHLELYHYLYTRSTLRVLNAAGNGWHNWATRGGGKYDLNVNNIVAAAVTVTTSNSPGLKISKDRNTDNRFLRFNDTGTNGKDYDIINNGNLAFYNHTDNNYILQITSGGNATFTGTLSASGYNNSNWDTAYGWGDHGAAGYLTSYTETDTLATVTARGASTTSNITTGTITANVSGTGVLNIGNAGTNAVYIQAGSGDELYIGNDGTYRLRFTGSNILMDNGGYLQSNASLRAPIFYSSSDTSYYLYPNNQLSLKVYGEICNSNVYEGNMQPGALNFGRVDTNYRWNGTTWASDVRLGMLLNFSEYYEIGFHDSNDSVNSFVYYNGTDFEMGRDIGWGTQHFTFTESVRAPIFYDSNNTGYYLDPTTTGNSLVAAGKILGSNINTNIKYLGTGVNYDTNRDLKVTDGIALYSAYNGGSNSPHTYDFSAQFVGNSRGFELSAAWHSQTSLKIRSLRDCCQNWSSWYTFALHGLNNSTGVLYAGAYYDASDTAYYVDPSGDSVMNQIHLNDYIRHNGDLDTYMGFNGANSWKLHVGGGDRLIVNVNQISSNLNLIMNNKEINYVHQLHFNDGVRFYDDGNDNYLNFKWNNGNNGGIRFIDGGGVQQGYVYGSGNGEFGILDKDGHWTLITNGSSYTALRSNNNEELVVYNDRVEVVADLRSPIFYDKDSTAHYVHPGNLSNLSGLNVEYGNQDLRYSNTVDMTGSSYNQSTYYPVRIYVSDITRIRIENRLNAGGTHPSWATHGSGFSLLMDWYTNGSGWGTVGITRTLRQWNEAWANVTICGGITQMTNSSAEVVWLRGGGKYLIKTSFNNTVQVSSSSHTGNGQTVTPTTSIVNDVYSSSSGSFSAGNIYGHKFWDAGDANYFLNPADTGVSLKVKGTAEFVTAAGHLRGYIRATDTNDSHFIIATSGGEDIAFKDGGTSGGVNMIIRGDGDVLTTRNHYAQTFYDSNNSTYYTNPASTSNLNAATFAGNIVGQNAYFGQDVGIGFTSGSIGGNLNIRNSAAGQTAAKIELGSSSNGSTIGAFIHTGASYASSGMFLNFQSNHISGDDNVLICYLDGDIVNKNNSYTQYSDEKLKENIVDATDKLEEVKQIKVRNFNFKGEDLKQIGVVAQELESIFPALVKEREVPGHEDPIKTVKYSVLVPILIKAMQEQQTIIDDLKSRLETLENQ